MEHTFTIDQKRLSHVLSAMQAICARRTTMDATSSILFQASHHELVLKSTDLEISVQYSCPLNNASISEPLDFLVSGRRIFELTKELDGDVQFNLNSNQIMLASGNAQLSLNIKDCQEFPPFPERIENLMELKAAVLLQMLEQVSFVIPQSNANPALNGLLVEINDQGMKMTATDGHCLAQAITDQYRLPEARSWLLPRRAVLELKKIIEASNNEKIFLGICGNQMVFSGDSFNFFTKLLVDSFPEYLPILNRDGFSRRVAPKADFIKALRRSACLLSGQFIATEFNLDDATLEVAMVNKEVGNLREQLTMSEYVPGSMAIRFYAPYLLNGLHALPGDTVIFWLHSTMRPIIFQAECPACQVTYLVMPVSPVTNA